jgi:hypothetical protein
VKKAGIVLSVSLFLILLSTTAFACETGNRVRGQTVYVPITYSEGPTFYIHALPHRAHLLHLRGVHHAPLSKIRAHALFAHKGNFQFSSILSVGFKSVIWILINQ